jgi:hypothetical protein
VGGTGKIGTQEDTRNAYRIFIGRYAARIPFRRSGHRKYDYIKIDLNEVSWSGVSWLRMGSSGALL